MADGSTCGPAAALPDPSSAGGREGSGRRRLPGARGARRDLASAGSHPRRDRVRLRMRGRWRLRAGLARPRAAGEAPLVKVIGDIAGASSGQVLIHRGGGKYQRYSVWERAQANRFYPHAQLWTIPPVRMRWIPGDAPLL